MIRIGMVAMVAALLASGCYDTRGIDRPDAEAAGVDAGHAVGVDAGAGVDAGGTDEVADAVTFCVERASWECLREHVAERISDAEYSDCATAIEPMCEGAAWPAGCAPTQEQTAACIQLIRRSDLLELPMDELLSRYDDCNLCP